MQKLTKLTLAVLMVTQFSNTNVAEARPPKDFIHIYKTSDKEALMDPYFQVKSYSIKELSDEEALEFNGKDIAIMDKGFVNPKIPDVPPTPPFPPMGPLDIPAPPAPRGGIIMIIEQLIAIGQKIIPNIKEGRPVVTNNPMASISVLPRTDAKDTTVHDMGGWTIPTSKYFRIAFKNGYGSEVVSFVYTISYQYNGNVNGKGKYLTGVRASARNISVQWGFDLDASSQLLQISNVGTQENIVAGATIEMTYTVKNWMKTISNSESFHITGDGKLYKLD